MEFKASCVRLRPLQVQNLVWFLNQSSPAQPPQEAFGWPSEIPLSLMSFPGESCPINTLRLNPCLSSDSCCWLFLRSTGRTTCADSTGCSGTPPTQNWLCWLGTMTLGSIMSKYKVPVIKSVNVQLRAELWWLVHATIKVDKVRTLSSIFDCQEISMKASYCWTAEPANNQNKRT